MAAHLLSCPHPAACTHPQSPRLQQLFMHRAICASNHLARSDKAGVASSLIRNAGFKEAWKCYTTSYLTVGGLLSDVQVMLSQTICAAYIHVYK
eukprot:1149946-Pelagomonas_calceolata.AAC.2